MFEEFFQVGNPERDREHGLGLGLSIVARVARVLDAEVALQSEIGRGSIFSVSLPDGLSQGAQQLPDEPTITPDFVGVDLAGVALLVIDDDLFVRDSMERLLVSWGAQVAVVGTAAEALGLITLRHWGACLCDLRLRDGDDGLTLAASLRNRIPDLPVIFMSGDTAAERIEQAMRSGHPLLHKPVDIEELARHLVHALHRRTAAKGSNLFAAAAA